jgi:hypothetical protein
MLLANILSSLLHPVFMPLIGLFIVFNSGIYGIEVPAQFRHFVYLITFLCDVLFPVTMVPVFIYFRNFQHVTLDERRQRLIPLFLTSICLFIGYYLVARFSPIRIINLFLFSSCMVVFIVFIISMFWKISIHMAGIGGITALIAILSISYKTDMTIVLCSAIILSGIIASIRLALKAHSPAQLLAGYAVGFITVGIFLIQTFI